MDSTEDLSALRIERAPRRASRRWVKWVVLLVLLAGAARDAWTWMTRERPVEVEVATVTERARRDAGVGPERVGLRHRAAPGHGVVEGHRQARGGQRRGRDGGRAKGRCSRAWTTPNVRAALRAGGGAARGGAPGRRRDRGAARRGASRRSSAASSCARTGLITRRRNGPGRRPRCNSLDGPHRGRRASRSTVAESQVALQQTELDDTVIRAPFSGVAISKDAQPGEMVSPVSAGGGFTRTGISTIVDMKSLEIEVDVNESYINRVAAGQPVTARARRVSRLADSRPRSSRRCRRPIGRRPRCWCASASTSSIRASCRTWASRSRSSAKPRPPPAAAARADRAGAEERGRARENGTSYVFVVRERRGRAARGSDRRHRRRSARSVSRADGRRPRRRSAAPERSPTACAIIVK